MSFSTDGKITEVLDRLPSRDELLSALGPARAATPRASVAEAVGLFAAGMVVGAAVTALFTPVSGPRARAEIARKARGTDDSGAA